MADTDKLTRHPGRPEARAAEEAAAVPLPRLVTRLQFAAVCGVVANTVTNWFNAGLPSVHDGGLRKVDLMVGVQWAIARERLTSEEQRAQLSEDQAKAAKLSAEARLKEIDLAEREGKLVDAEDVTSTWAQIIVATREAVMTVAGNAVQSGTIPAAKELELEELCREALTALSRRDL